jgi:phenylpropionate dioxygenase-like ring-hydroxylating dioxygenase large terminal subunit
VIETTGLIESIRHGSALPTEWFTDPAIFRAELEKIHRKAWHYVGHVGELAAPGDVIVRDVARVPVVLTRAADGVIRGHINICRHRGYPVVVEDGNQRVLSCHYHGWAYELDGSLKNAPRSAGDDAFDPSAFGLVPVQVETWGPMVWVNIDRDGPSLGEWIPGMNDLLLARGCDVTQYSFGMRSSWEIDANWKVFQDNTIECYHCPTTHPEFARGIKMNPKTQELGVGGDNWIHHRLQFRDGIDEGPTFKRPADGSTFYYHYNWIFPTTYLQHSGKGFDIGSVNVLAVDKIRFTHTWFMPPGTPVEQVELGQRLLEHDPTIHQDVDICNKVQAGHATGVAPTGRSLVEPEFLLTHFHQRIVELVGKN